MSKYHLITFGCQMNKSDSERIAAVLENIGYKPASKINEANLIVVNMCSVRQSAVDRVFGKCQKLVKLQTLNPKLKTILTGCLLKEDRKKFRDKFDLILDIKDLPQWPPILSKKHYNITTLQQYNNYLQLRPKYQSRFSTLIPISNGCDNFCSYCVVPYVRGRLVCRPAKEIIEEIKNLVKREVNPIRNMISNGAREIWLLGQNVNSYNSLICANAGTNLRKYSWKFAPKLAQIREVNFPKLLKMANDVPGDFWLRFTSPHPKDFSDELMETMAGCRKITPYLNLPVQSGDNKILRKMNRDYTAGEYKNLVKKIRKTFAKIRGKFPPISISTDVIVGFPGETKKQFEATLKLFKEIKFDMAYIAKYSPRPGTAAAKLKDSVSKQEKERRYKVLTEILKETALKNNKKYINKIVDVLPEYKKGEWLVGKTKTYKTIKIRMTKSKYQINAKIQNPKLIGKFIKVRVIKALSWGLGGELA